MEVVGPLRVEAEPPRSGGQEEARVVQVALGDDVDAAGPSRSARPRDRRRQLLQERAAPRVDDGVDGVEAQAVEVVLVEPVQGVLDEEAADRVAVRAVEVEASPQGSCSGR